MSAALIKKDLNILWVDIENMIEVLRLRANEIGSTRFELQTTDGHSPLIPLLAAKAAVLSALATLEAAK